MVTEGVSLGDRESLSNMLNNITALVSQVLQVNKSFKQQQRLIMQT